MTCLAKMMVLARGLPKILLRRNPWSCRHNLSGCSSTTYEQGQVSGNVREYFYFVDHQGQLFLDDARMKNFTSCFKERDFLRFFFKRVKIDDKRKYPDFPFVSPCGVEINYIRCDDTPIVFTKLVEQDGEQKLSYNNGEEKLLFPFQPSMVCMQPETGRVYHPAPEKAGGVGLVKSLIAIDWSQYFLYKEGDDASIHPPDGFRWNGKLHILTNSLFPRIDALYDINTRSSLLK